MSRSQSSLQVQFVRTGGFAGIRLSCNLDSAELPENQAQELQELVEKADFFEMPDIQAPAASVPDSFEYRVTIFSGKQSRSVVVADPRVPKGLRPLVAFLVSLAKPQQAR